MSDPNKKIVCSVCKKDFPAERLISGHGIRRELEEILKERIPDWSDDSFICEEDLDAIRGEYVTRLVKEERGNIDALEQEVIRSIHENELLAANVNEEFAEKPTFGERVADAVARFGGSWTFIVIFFIILFGWIAMNSALLWWRPFDPYPFILMNLILSCLAAIQAPIIMMSQNRQETKDRLRSENDYKVNLKAEIEIRTLHEKMDHLMLDQWSRLLRIQEVQIDMLNELAKKKQN